MKKLSVVYIVLHFPYLTETFVANEIAAMRRRGVHVHIVSLLEPGKGQVHPVSQELLPYCRYAPGLLSPTLWLAQFYTLFTSPRAYFSLLFGLLRQPYPRAGLTLFAKRLFLFLKAVTVSYEFRNQRVELIHAHFAWLAGAGAWIVARLLDKPFTVTTHAYDIYAKNELLNMVVREADQVFTISDYNRDYIQAHCNCAPEKVSIVRCGIDPARFDALVSPAGKADESGPVRLLSVGSLNPKKGHHTLIEACRRLRDAGADISCTIVGDGSLRASLQSSIDEYGLTETVNLAGPQSQDAVFALFSKADIFVLACEVASNGDRDGIPVALMEAGAARLPLVSTEVSGIPELVRNGETGFAVPEHNPQALADAISRLISDPDLRRRLGKNAYALVLSEFNIEISADRMYAEVDRIVSSHTPPANRAVQLEPAID